MQYSVLFTEFLLGMMRTSHGALLAKLSMLYGLCCITLNLTLWIIQSLMLSSLSGCSSSSVPAGASDWTGDRTVEVYLTPPPAPAALQPYLKQMLM